MLVRAQRRVWPQLARTFSDFESKYADKLSQRAKREGVASVEELKAKHTERIVSKAGAVRNDSSPVKPLTDIMDLKKIIDKKQTAEQVSALWMAYHASRSEGTGRGYLSATIPLESYLKMSSLATKYPSFILPLSRPAEPDASSPAYEFHFLQWGFYHTPPHPLDGDATEIPAYSMILFTPLGEYKLRQTFAQPHLVLTNYTDLATTHGIVLMRGELTASSASPGKYLLSQVDAQQLAMGMQRFYLSTEDAGSVLRVEMLQRFHDRPDEFDWKEMVNMM